MTTQTIHVRGKHLEKGQVRDPDHCPVARALREAGFPRASVTLSMRIDGVVLLQNVPRIHQQMRVENHDLYRRITAYDYGGAMTPFTFTLELPETTT